MRTIVLSFEYKVYPIWVYDEEFIVDYCDWPDEWEDDPEMKAKLNEAQDLYDSAFIDDGKTFDFVGFKNDKKKLEHFKTLINEIRAYIKEHLPNGYAFEDWVIDHDELKDF